MMATSAQPKRKFAFDLAKPLMRGPLQKQGEILGVIYKQRYFVLYPGFLVYYDDKDTWKYDLQRGQTLGSRLGAIKLKGGRVEKTQNPPKGAKEPFTIFCPDSSNKKKEVIINCKSKEERYQWMTHIQSAIPGGVLTEKNDKDNSSRPKNEEPNKSTDNQDTPLSSLPVDLKVIAEGEHIDEVLGPQDEEYDSDKEEEKAVTSSVTIEIKKKEEEIEPPKKPPPQLPTQETEEELEEITTEVILNHTEAPNFVITVIDHSMLGASDDESSEEGYTPNSSHSTPPPTIEVIEDRQPPQTVPVTKITPPASPPSASPVPVIQTELVANEHQQPTSILLQPEADSNTLSEIKPGQSTLDKRRPSGGTAFIDKRGLLYKMGGKFKSWNLRYFVLQPGVFNYYKNDPKGKALGEVKLKNITITFPKKGDKIFSPYQFTLHTDSSWNKRKDWSIAASTEKEMKEWILAFETAGGSTRSCLETL